jgi:uncharacterized paraquat-inducible protein A
MIKCPECNAEQSNFRVITLTNSNHIDCPACAAKLKAKRDRNSLIGGIGGASGALIGILLFYNPSSVVLWFSFAAGVMLVIAAQLRFTKLYVSKT